MFSNSARKILLVTDLWHTHPNGPATVVRNLKRELEARGHRVDIIEPGQFRTVPFLLYPEVRIPLFARRSIRRSIVNGAYDYIHLVTEGLLGWHARSICKRRRIPFTTAFHGQLDLYALIWLGSIAQRLIRRLLVHFHSAAALTLVTTHAIQSHLSMLGLHRVRVCPLGVDPIFFQQAACPVKLKRPVFMYFGRVSSEKNITEFAEANLPGTKIVVGDGPDRKKLAARFPRLRFIGYKTGESLIAWCSCADVMVMPSRTETFGLVIIEALALGIPVAAHDVLGPREIILNGINGYLDEDLAVAAKKCLSLTSEACRDSVRNYTWETSTETFLSILSSVQ